MTDATRAADLDAAVRDLAEITNMIINSHVLGVQHVRDIESALREAMALQREADQDEIAGHKARIADLETVLESLTPDVKKFVEALQKLG